jgi:RNA polymerase sigma-70 factor (ECF subfamily)
MGNHEKHDLVSDDGLLREACSGCTDCFAVLFHRYCRGVFSIANRILRDPREAEDILQEVFLAIFQQQERYDASRGSVRTWILQFAYFKALVRRCFLSVHRDSLKRFQSRRSAGWSR